VLSTFARKAAGASSARHSLLPSWGSTAHLFEEGGTFQQNSRERRGENAELCLKLECRHCERSEAIQSCFLIVAWIASLRSQ
jgi:hypothetical protein